MSMWYIHMYTYVCVFIRTYFIYSKKDTYYMCMGVPGVLVSFHKWGLCSLWRWLASLCSGQRQRAQEGWKSMWPAWRDTFTTDERCCCLPCAKHHIQSSEHPGSHECLINEETETRLREVFESLRPKEHFIDPYVKTLCQVNQKYGIPRLPLGKGSSDPCTAVKGSH